MFQKGRVPFTPPYPNLWEEKGNQGGSQRETIPGRERTREEVSQLKSYSTVPRMTTLAGH